MADNILIPSQFIIEYLTESDTIEADIEMVTGKSIYKVYREMMAKDGRIGADITTRIFGSINIPFTITPANDTAEAKKFHEFIMQEVINNPLVKPKIYKLFFYILQCIPYGRSYTEIIWKEKDGFAVIEKGRIIYPELIEEKKDGLYIQINNIEKQKVPDYKIIRAIYGEEFKQNGMGLLARVFWYYWFKKHFVKFWLLFGEKFGVPTVAGKYKRGIPEEEKRELLEICRSIQQDTAIVYPDTAEVSFLEAKRQADKVYETFLQWADKQITATVLGQTLTVSEGKTGSYAQAKIHNEIRWDYIKFDALILQEALQTVINWIAELNTGASDIAPIVEFDTSEPEDLKYYVDIYQKLTQMGLEISKDFLYQKFKIQKPISEEDILGASQQTVPFSETEKPNIINPLGYHISRKLHDLNDTFSDKFSERLEEVVKKIWMEGISE